MQRADSLEKTLMLGKTDGRRRRGWQRMMDTGVAEPWELVMDKEAWRAVVHGVTKSRTRLSKWIELNWSFTQQLLQSPEETKPKPVVFRAWKSKAAESMQCKQCEAHPKGPERMTKPISSTKSYLRLSTGNYLSKVLTTPLDVHVVMVNNTPYFEVFFNISSGSVLKLCGVSWSLLVYQNLFGFLVLRKCWL